MDKATKFDWPVDIKTNHCQLSYLISGNRCFGISPNQIQNALEQINHHVRQTVWTGWSMYFPFTRPEIAAAIYPEFQDGTGTDVLESNLLNDSNDRAGLPDYWRFAADGRATILRPYREDRPNLLDRIARDAGTWLSPETVIRETAELVTHARVTAIKFGGTRVSFRCSWNGLDGREIDDFGGVHWSPGSRARATSRTVAKSWNVEALSDNWHEAVADLSRPVLILFGFENCDASLVQRMAPRFVKL